MTTKTYDFHDLFTIQISEITGKAYIIKDGIQTEMCRFDELADFINSIQNGDIFSNEEKTADEDDQYARDLNDTYNNIRYGHQ